MLYHYRNNRFVKSDSASKFLHTIRRVQGRWRKHEEENIALKNNTIMLPDAYLLPWEDLFLIDPNLNPAISQCSDQPHGEVMDVARPGMTDEAAKH
jgi:hypothetical protein